MSIVLNLEYNKNKQYRTWGYWSTDMLNFNFLEKKGLGIVSPPHFSRKMFFQEKCFPYYILLPDQISMSDCFYFLSIG